MVSYVRYMPLCLVRSFTNLAEWSIIISCKNLLQLIRIHLLVNLAVNGHRRGQTAGADASRHLQRKLPVLRRIADLHIQKLLKPFRYLLSAPHIARRSETDADRVLSSRLRGKEGIKGSGIISDIADMVFISEREDNPDIEANGYLNVVKNRLNGKLQKISLYFNPIYKTLLDDPDKVLKFNWKEFNEVRLELENEDLPY